MKAFLEMNKIRLRDLGKKIAARFFGAPERTIECSFVTRNLPKRTNMKILELGCGESLLSYRFARMRFEVWAIDVNPYPFIHRNLNFLQGDITQMKLPSSYFDCAISVSVIEHIGLGWCHDHVKSDGGLQ